MQSNIGDLVYDLRTRIFNEDTRTFSARCGISKTCLLNIENGITINPSNETIKKIEKGTNVLLGEFRLDPRLKQIKSKKKKRFAAILHKRKTVIMQSIQSLTILADCELIELDLDQLETLKKNVNYELSKVIKQIEESHIKERQSMSYDEVDKLYKSSIKNIESRGKENE